VKARLLVLLLVVGVAVLAAQAVRFQRDAARLSAGGAAGAEAVAAARAYVPDLLSYDYRTIDDDLARAAGHATGPLASHYRQLAATLVPRAREEQKVQQAVVAAAGVESATPDAVRVLVFVNMTTTRAQSGKDLPRQEVTQNRARLVMVRTDHGWRVSDLSTLLGDTPTR
jgi:Mce-associated membrane protein